LVGLKENVILGRLIPSGTGVKEYREIDVNVQRGSWAEQSLQALVESEDMEFDDEFESLNFPSLSDMASEEMDLDGI
jgi:DNA-directed RNA polymerase subunit beta'